LNHSALAFVAVGSPALPSGETDLSQVYCVAGDIGEVLENYIRVAVKSTVPVGTGDQVEAIIKGRLAERGLTHLLLDVISNPEFLREGTALGDFMVPSRVVVGTDDPDSRRIMRELYSPFCERHGQNNICMMSRRSGEAAKYAANGLLANRLDFINAIALWCEANGANVDDVVRSMRWDSRIGTEFLYPGHGYGGSCFPKDSASLAHQMGEAGIDPSLIEEGQRVNELLKRFAVNRAVRIYGDDLSGRTFGLLGLAFKPGTDDMREAPSITIVEGLTGNGAHVQAYDPQANNTAAAEFLRRGVDMSRVSFANNPYAAANGADAIILATEWDEFHSLDFTHLRRVMGIPDGRLVLIDGRNRFFSALGRLRRAGVEYHPVGVSPEVVAKMIEQAE